MARLYVLSGSDVGRSFDVRDGDTIGRGQDCILVLKDRSISRRHAHLELREEGWSVVDDGSRNGLTIGAKRLQRAALPDGQEFLLGEVLLRFREEPAAAVAPPPAPPPPPEVAAREAPAAEVVFDADVDDVAPTRSRAPSPPAAPASEADEIVLEDAEEIVLGRGGPPGGAPSELGRTYVGRGVAPPAPVAAGAAEAGFARPSRAGLEEQRGRVLQYHRTSDSGSLFSFELAQLPAWQRYGLYLAGALLLVGAFWLALFGAAFLRDKLQGPAPVELEGEG